jgi:hypothetical protein
MPTNMPALPDLLNELSIEFLLLLSGRLSTRVDGTTSASNAKHMPAIAIRSNAWPAVKNRLREGEKTTAYKKNLPRPQREVNSCHEGLALVRPARAALSSAI